MLRSIFGCNLLKALPDGYMQRLEWLNDPPMHAGVELRAVGRHGFRTESQSAQWEWEWIDLNGVPVWRAGG
jgi:hypothetical protein